jgi:uncharacterized protein YutE (UPF0331/DUF86 family)
MDSENEMIVEMMEEEEAFDDDLRGHLSIIASLQNILVHAVEVQSREERIRSTNRGWRGIP